MGKRCEDVELTPSNSIRRKRTREVTPDPVLASSEPGKRQKRLASNRRSPSSGSRLKTSLAKVKDDVTKESSLESWECEDHEEYLSTCRVFNFKEKKRVTRAVSGCKKQVIESDVEVLDPILPEEAHQRWPARYCEEKKTYQVSLGDEDDVQQAKVHYKRAKVDGVIYCLGEDAYVKADEGRPNYIARITEIFKNIEGEDFFCAQWFFRVEDTVIQNALPLAEKQRVFISDVRDDNPLNCIISKVKVEYIPPNLNLIEKLKKHSKCDVYYDMKYSIPFCTFATVNTETIESDISTISSENCLSNSSSESSNNAYGKAEMTLLDLYAGCGAMSSGFCMGADKAGLNLVCRWAVDINCYACESLEKNHLETKVWNMAAEDFLSLLKEWEKLCTKFSLYSSSAHSESIKSKSVEDSEDDNDEPLKKGVYVVEKLVDVCYGDPYAKNKPGMYFKVRWKGYSPEDDTWEPLNGLRNCNQKLKEFVIDGYKLNILPLPGSVDVICGGPPCQGISGLNRFRNTEAPLEDEKNKQLIIFMDFVEYLKPRYVLMENVVDILKFSDGFCGRYAIGRLVSMNYQARLGILAAGHYGVPQFRNRVFFWGCHPLKCLPQYPLPTHDALNRGSIPVDFKEITVAYEIEDKTNLNKGLTLKDALFDLPPASNNDSHDVKSYVKAARTDFQKHIRIRPNNMVGFHALGDKAPPQKLYDHVPLPLPDDDYQRVCRIPKRKGANFRDLPGVLVNQSNNTVYFDPSVERVLLSSGKPLVPNYAMSFSGGKSTRPFARLWWDETVPTVVTRAEPHNQATLHPQQDRVLTVRENARLQGFPDCYRFYGPIKQKYMQIGNAVAVPVAFALGYCWGIAYRKSELHNPLASLPFSFPSCLSKSQDITDAEISD